MSLFPVLHPLSLNLSVGPASPSITADIESDNPASQEPIITGSFNQLVPIQLPLNLRWAAMLTQRVGWACKKGLQGSVVPGEGVKSVCSCWHHQGASDLRLEKAEPASLGP